MMRDLNIRPGKGVIPVLATLLAGVCVAGAALAWWRGAAPGPDVARRLPQAYEIMGAPADTGAVETVRIGENFTVSAGIPSQWPGEWPCFRGSRHDNVAPDSEVLANAWPSNGPPRLWSIELGEGYAGPAILNGRVYLLDYDGREGADALRCLSLDDGREIWRRWYKVRIKRNHGISRTVPSVTERCVVTIGPRCHVMAVDPVTGDFKWGIDLEKEWGAEVPMWYTGQCPLIDGRQVVLGVGGKALLMGVDIDTGKVVWQTPNPDKWLMSHASVMPMEFNGRKMYIYCAVGGIIGVSAEPADAGTVLWTTDAWNFQVVAPTPVPLDNGLFLVTSGYGAGSALFQVAQEGGKYSVSLVTRLDKKTFACEQHTPVFYKGHLYTVLPADAGAVRKEAVCMEPGGKVVWRSGPADRFGLGPFMIADGKLLILEDNGVLTLAKATELGYTRLAQAKVLDGKEAWAPLALAGGRLLVRDYSTLRCLDLSREPLAVKKVDAGAVRRGGSEWIKSSLSNVTALAVGRQDEIFVGAKMGIEVMNRMGVHRVTIPVAGTVRALAQAVNGDLVVGLDDHVEIYDQAGVRKAVWKSPAPNTMVTSVAASSNAVFVADCQNRIVWRFNLSGEVTGRLGDKSPSRPEGFVVPSAFFDVATAPDGTVWIVNPGMHRVEHFDSSGTYLSGWGKASTDPDGFCGCCNPSNIALAPDGSFVTSEKHLVRVKRYDAAGRFTGIISGQDEWGKDVVGLDLAVDSTGRILVLDPSSDSIRMYSSHD